LTNQAAKAAWEGRGGYNCIMQLSISIY
jgi:hypothetical protein